jgi:hypothetical protein
LEQVAHSLWEVWITCSRFIARVVFPQEAARFFLSQIYAMASTLRLSPAALDFIRQQSGIKPQLAIALGVSEGTINRYIRENDDCLTKAAALEVIRKETGFADRELLAVWT